MIGAKVYEYALTRLGRAELVEQDNGGGQYQRMA